MDNTGDKRRRVLLISFPAQGHINPTLQFAKRLTRHLGHVTFVTSLSVYRRMPQIPTLPHISFASFSDGYDHGFKPGNDEPIRFLSEMERLGSQAIRDMIRVSAEEGQPFTCVVYSIFLPWVAVVARSLHLPSILLWIQPATVFTLYYHYFNGYKDSIIQSILDDPSRTIQLPGLPLLTGREVPLFLLSSNVYDFAFSIFQKLFELLAQQTNPKVLVNTFEALEQDVVREMDKFHLVPIGPLVPSAFLDCEDPSDASFGGDMFPCSRDNDDYMSWLNSNPKAAVVYVSFGSISRLSKEQKEEIASGLLSFGQPFLWVIKDEDMGDDTLSCREELEAVGKIVPWCSQLEVLSSPATGCFVTHCGWNSTLESLVCGVPMVGFPQWADQGTNAKIIEDMTETGVRVEVGMDGMVKREEIKRCLEVVMGDSNKGEEIRKKALKWKELAKGAARDGGSSDANFKVFVDQVCS
ncbi:crocetin glucosyltransferase, chloroplastic-like [Cucurbita moschata]|uniref:Glycosyltransferase n=1 Tax=Cucurbita moschata TaxID=3662 RepID=A0A6J1HHH8_CUCMO|nr:crocetin glucosyltransferase, chloroplastic-like [Cucurbita moschata]